MLVLTIPEVETFDEATGEFHQCPQTVLRLEHSLLSISKWEETWCISFLDDRYEKTPKQTLDYIKCMTINNVNPMVYLGINDKHIQKVNAYIESPRSATTFSSKVDDTSSSTKKQIITSELIYSWMIECKIPFECQKWNLNRLMNLIRIREIQLRPPKKMKRGQITSRNAALNAARRKKLNSKG